MLASESWLVLLVRIGGSELATDSVSLFCNPKEKKKTKNNTLVFLYVMVFSRETTSKLEYYKNYRLYKTGELD